MVQTHKKLINDAFGWTQKALLFAPIIKALRL
jgi:hypothetical protein